ncbi:MAG: hypothetical protein KAG61_02635 [Bacteriovoracaceae bacterium]|nr:hypothetical protein [Bacteriovoracaceae bacterium]
MNISEIVKPLSSELQATYSDKVEDLREYLKIDFNSDLLTDDFHQTLYKLIFSTEAEIYSPLKHFWLKSVEDFFYILELHYDQEDGGLSEDEDLFSQEERFVELEEAWTKTPFAGAFNDMLNEEVNVSDASMALISLMESQILSFYYVHFPSEEFECETAFLYNAHPALGDYENRIYLTDSCKVVEFEQSFELYPSIPVSEIDHNGEVLGIDENAETTFLQINKNQWSFKTATGKVIQVLPSDESHCDQMDATTKKLSEIFAKNPILSSVANSLLSVVIPSSNQELIAEGLYDRLYFDLSRDESELESDLLFAAGELLAHSIDEAYQITGEEDDSAYFSCPWRNEKLPYLPIALETISRAVSGRISNKERAAAATELDRAKKKDLVSKEVHRIISALIK